MGANTECFVKIARQVVEYVEVSAATLDEARAKAKSHPDVTMILGASYNRDDYDDVVRSSKVWIDD